MSEDVIDCVSHVVDVRLSVDLLTVCVYHYRLLGFLERSSDFFFVLCPFLATLAQVPESVSCGGVGFVLALVCC